MALTNNPNKTKSIEKKWRAEINRRWSLAWNRIKEIPLIDIVVNLSSEEQVEVDSFIDEFTIIVLLVLLSNNRAAWQNKYQEQAYFRSLAKATAEVKAAALQVDFAKTSFISSAIASAMLISAHKNELSFLTGRARDKLAGWVNLLIVDVKGMVNDNYGKIPNPELLAKIRSRLDVTRSKARMIATTEITQASQRAAINQATALSEAMETEVKLRWITVADSRVRHLHASWHGTIMTKDKALSNMSISPFNCRCGLRPIIVNRVTEQSNTKFTKERKQLLDNEKDNVA